MDGFFLQRAVTSAFSYFHLFFPELYQNSKTTASFDDLSLQEKQSTKIQCCKIILMNLPEVRYLRLCSRD